MNPIVATLAEKIGAASQEIRLIPCGVFRANDGRPVGLPGWKMDTKIALKIIADRATRDDLVIDFEHQTLLAKQNGQPNPAAGWFKRLVWRDGEGLFAVDVKWTEKAKAMLAAREYRYISPAFSYNGITGEVEDLLCAALTNNPGLTHLTDLAQIAVNSNQPGTAPRESLKSIDSFNHVFGSHGVFHPETPAESLAQLTGKTPKPTLSNDLTEQEKHIFRSHFPGAFQN